MLQILINLTSPNIWWNKIFLNVFTLSKSLLSFPYGSWYMNRLTVLRHNYCKYLWVFLISYAQVPAAIPWAETSVILEWRLNWGRILCKTLALYLIIQSVTWSFRWPVWTPLLQAYIIIHILFYFLNLEYTLFHCHFISSYYLDGNFRFSTNIHSIYNDALFIIPNSLLMLCQYFGFVIFMWKNELRECIA